jgi:hypothetical protein
MQPSGGSGSASTHAVEHALTSNGITSVATGNEVHRWCTCSIGPSQTLHVAVTRAGNGDRNFSLPYWAARRSSPAAA